MRAHMDTMNYSPYYKKVYNIKLIKSFATKKPHIHTPTIIHWVRAMVCIVVGCDRPIFHPFQAISIGIWCNQSGGRNPKVRPKWNDNVCSFILCNIAS